MKKIKPEHFEKLKAAIAPLDTEDNRQFYRDGKCDSFDKVKDLNRRYRWDLLFSSKSSNLIIEIYDYANDKHIDTALREIVKEL